MRLASVKNDASNFQQFGFFKKTFFLGKISTHFEGEKMSQEEKLSHNRAS